MKKVSDRQWRAILSHRNSESPFQLNGHAKIPSLEGEYYKVLDTIKNAKIKRPVVIAHIAQTLDGRIACVNGDSKWIGNKENLRHAHRMRALCDAVMVGNRTVTNDKPQLTVRHVEGKNPIKLLLEGHTLCGNHYKKVCYLEKGNDHEAISWRGADDLLDSLFARGIRSVYLEGGGKTISYFLKEELVDRLQIHIAPIILGSGIASFSLPESQKIGEALTFMDETIYSIDGEFMISGAINYL